jgi:hypothetical protein
MKRLIILLIALAMIGSVSAAPGAPVITGITSNGFTATSAGATAPLWFMWGGSSTSPGWKTPNTTTDHWIVKGSPVMPATVYYIKACDSTGTCSAIVTFTTSSQTPIPVSTLGSTLDNITANNFDMMNTITNLPAPYLWGVPAGWTSNGMGIALCAGLLFGFYFLGLWFRQRRVTGPMLLGLVVLAFIMTPQTGLNFGMPQEIVMIGQMVTYAALAGVILSLFKK